MNDKEINVIAEDLSVQLYNLKNELKNINPLNNKDYISTVYNIIKKYCSNDFPLTTQILNLHIEDMINNIQTDKEKLTVYIKSNNIMTLFSGKNGAKDLAYIMDYAILPLETMQKKYNQPSSDAVTQKISRKMYKYEAKGLFELLNIYDNDEYCKNGKYSYRKIAEKIMTIAEYETKFLFPNEKTFIQLIKLVDKLHQGEISENLKNTIIKSKTKKYKTVTKKPQKQ